MSTNPVADKFLEYAATRLQQLEGQIHICIAQLSEEQMWRRGGEHENSVANLLLHLEGNLRQWILHGIAGQPDVRERDAEFRLTPVAAKAEVWARFSATLGESREVIAGLPTERLLEVIDPQPASNMRHVTILESIFKVVSHLDHHAGQIIVLTKQMVARDLDLSIARKR
jgi:uncharacterized damage-inducible protein DinB